MIKNVELRWYTRKTGNRVIDKYGMFRDGEETVLQYRVLGSSEVNRDADAAPKTISRTGVPYYIEITHTWSEWVDVPSVHENSVPSTSNKCTSCGILLEGTMSYCCSQPNCPTGLGSSIS